MPRSKAHAPQRVVFGLGVIWLLIAIAGFAVVFFEVSNWRIAGLEKEFHATLSLIGLLNLVTGGLCVSAAMFLKSDSTKNVIHSILINSSLFLLGIFFAGIIMEVVLHMKYRDVQIGGFLSPSRYTFYAKYFHLNEVGFRDITHSLGKPEGTYRIVAVGDSFTFGAGVKRIEDLYFKVLEKKLQEAFPEQNFESVSVAKKGWNTAQEFEAFRTRGIEYDPNLVVLGYYLNDFETPEIKARWEENFHHSHFLPNPYGKFFYATSFAYYILEQKLKAIPFFRDQDTSIKSYYREILSEENLRQNEKTLREFLEFIHAHNIRVIVLLFPDLRAISRVDYPYSKVHQFVANTAKGAGAEFLDLSGPLKASGIKNFTVSEFDAHPSKEVHRIAGLELFQAIKEKWVGEQGKHI